MTKLSDTQAIVLAAAAQRADGNVLPLPRSLRGGAAAKVVGAMLARGLIREHVVGSDRKADPALNTIWRSDEEGRGVMLRITSVGLDAIGVESATEPDAAVAYALSAGANSAGEPAAGAPTGGNTVPIEASPRQQGRTKKAAPTGANTVAPRKARGDSKQAQLIAMLRREQGATIAQIVEATGWQAHTVRSAFAGALKKRLGLAVTSEKVEGVRVYRLPG